MPHKIKLENIEYIYSSTQEINKSKSTHQKIKKIHNLNDNSLTHNKKVLYSLTNANSTHKKHFDTLNNNNMHTLKNISNLNSYKQAVIQEKCEAVIDSLQSYPETRSVFQTIINEELTHLTIARNVSMEKYKTLYELFLDLRKLWVLYLDYYQDNEELRSKTMAIISFGEGLWKSMENSYNQSKLLKTLPLQERPMNIKEKSTLANHIRNLPNDQLKGLLNLLDKNKEMHKKKEYYEVDLDKLTVERLREVEKYVKSCMKSSKNLVPARYQEEFEQNLRKSDNSLKDINNNNNTQSTN